MELEILLKQNNIMIIGQNFMNRWNYQAPKKCINILKKKLNKKPKYILDLACGTGLFGLELNNLYNKSIIYGSDISAKSLEIARKKIIYKNLKKINFETRHLYNIIICHFLA